MHIDRMTRAALVASILLMLIGLAIAQKETISAKSLFYAPETTAAPTLPGAVKTQPKITPTHASGTMANGSGGSVTRASISANNPGLKFQLLKLMPDGSERPVDPSSTFRSGDRIRFVFESNTDGFLNIQQQGSSGVWRVLFPDPNMNGGSNYISKGKKYLVPGQGSSFHFDRTPGVEHLTVYLSKSASKDLPGSDHPVMQAMTVTQSVIDQLRGEVRSRDLVFETDTAEAPDGSKLVEATYVVNKQLQGQAIFLTLDLKHQ